MGDWRQSPMIVTGPGPRAEERLLGLVAQPTGPLRVGPDEDGLSLWMVRAHNRHWRTHLDWREPP